MKFQNGHLNFTAFEKEASITQCREHLNMVIGNRRNHNYSRKVNDDPHSKGRKMS